MSFRDPRPRVFLLLAGFTLLMSAASIHARADTAVRIRGVDMESFPQVTVTVSVAGSVAKPEDVRVTEQGHAITGLTVTSLSQSGQGVDVVLAVDASNSMQGGPLASAIAAALTFVTSLPDDQPIRVGIVEFADHPTVVQPLTSDRSSLLTRLGALSTTQGTAMYDAVVASAKLFTGTGQRNIVLLSDGGDRSSTRTLKEAVAAARAAHAAVFAVGLETADTDVAALQTLARETGGRYAPAGTADLSAVYTGLASELSNQFVVTYRSTRRAGGEVSVAVTVGGAGDSAVVLEPKIQPPPAPPPSPAPPSKPPLGGDTGLLVVLGLAFAAAFWLLYMMLGARARARSDQELVKRVATQTAATETPERSERGFGGWLPQPVVMAGEQVGRVGGIGARAERMLERSGLPLKPGELVAGVILAGVIGAVIGGVLLHNPIFMAIIGGFTGTAPVVWLKWVVKKRSTKLHGQLADILMILASSLRAGHGFFQALDLVAKEIGEPGAQEFGRVVAEVRLGRPVDEALNHMAERIGSDDFKWAVLGVNIQREVGGNLAEVLDTVADTVRERDQVRRQVQVLSSEGRLSIGILAALPFLVSLYIAKVNPGYLNLLFSTGAGLVMVITAGCLLGIGIMWMRKIVKIDV